MRVMVVALSVALKSIDFISNTMPRIINRVGSRFGRLVVESLSRKNAKGQSFWNCRCDCGNTKEVFGGNLNSGNIKSCGCLRSEGNNSKHGHSKNGKQSREYICWVSMKGRCLNPSNNRFHQYGGRGITVCQRWVDSFENFLSDMGPKPSPRHSINRIDNSKGYSPENTVWSTEAEQQRNKRNSSTLSMNGITKCIAQWAEDLMVPSSVLYARKRLGWSDERILSQPVRKHI